MVETHPQFPELVVPAPANEPSARAANNPKEGCSLGLSSRQASGLAVRPRRDGGQAQGAAGDGHLHGAGLWRDATRSLPSAAETEDEICLTPRRTDCGMSSDEMF